MRPRKLILSRKGFDSGSGGCPSPIFPDGTMFSLPIPSYDEEAFEDLQHGDIDIVSVVTGVTNGRMSGRNLIHLDPDLNFDAHRHRKDRADWQEWRGMLGQAGIAQSHLNNQGVASGDLFLFFGLYRRVEETAQGWRFVSGSPELHILWGWLQIYEKYPVADIGPNELAWARHHPHIARDYRGDKNTVYAAFMKLDLDGKDHQCAIAGWGVFPQTRPTTGSDRPQWCGRFELAAPAVVLSRRQQAAVDLPSRPLNAGGETLTTPTCRASAEGRSSCWTSLITPKPSSGFPTSWATSESTRGADDDERRLISTLLLGRKLGPWCGTKRCQRRSGRPFYLNASSGNSSACSITVLIASSCLSGGYPYRLRLRLTIRRRWDRALSRMVQSMLTLSRTVSTNSRAITRNCSSPRTRTALSLVAKAS